MTKSPDLVTGSGTSGQRRLYSSSPAVDFFALVAAAASSKLGAGAFFFLALGFSSATSSAWTVTVSLGGLGRDRLLLEYQHNRNALAVAADGSPTSLAADTLTLRGQVVFQ